MNSRKMRWVCRVGRVGEESFIQGLVGSLREGGHLEVPDVDVKII
jgi:hypothetical protein